MDKSTVILISQFTTPKAKSFSTYVNYMTRKEALLESKKILTDEEEKELTRIQNVINKYDMEQGKAYLLENQKVDSSEKEVEAKTILKTKKEFHNETDFSKYISYMSRQYTLEKKKNLSLDEEQELEVIKHSISNLPKEKSISEEKTPPLEIKEGVFSIDKDTLTTKDLEQVHNTIKKAQDNGSVFYQDVISFDNDFLIKEKLLNPNTNELDEKKIQYASRKMMDSMFKDEKIESGYWFASIHRNTKHIHIHYGTVELKNTRELMTIEEDGVFYVAPKGKRKQKTIDNMKSTFENALIDRTAKLSRISELRNILVDEIKQTYAEDKEYLEKIGVLKDIFIELPANKKHWHYGSKHVTNQTRNKIDYITEYLMRSNPHYKEYLEKTEEESSYRKELFGDINRAEKDYGLNKKKEVQKRLGNALLAQMRKQTTTSAVMKRNYQDNPYSKRNSQESSHKEKIISKKSSYKKPLISRKTMRQLECAVNDDYAKYRAEKEHEQVLQRIAWEQEKNEL